MAVSIDKLKVYYKFNEASGDLINHAIVANGFDDGLGDAVDGTITGATQGATGRIDEGYSFDDLEYITLGSDASLFNFMHNTTAVFTMNFWYKKDNVGDKLSPFVNSNQNTSADGIDFGSASATNLRFVVRDGTGGFAGAPLNTGVTLPITDDTEWHMYTLTYEYNGTGVQGSEWFVDGVSQEVDVTSDNEPLDTDADKVPQLGEAPDGTWNTVGIIDEFAIWNRVVTDAEITDLYNGGAGLELSTSDDNFTLSGTHATQALYKKKKKRQPLPVIGPRREQLIPVEFSLIAKSTLVRKPIETIKLTSTLVRDSISKIHLKLPLLVEIKDKRIGMEATLLKQVTDSLIKVKAETLPCLTVKNDKIKAFLLEKIEELIGNERS